MCEIYIYVQITSWKLGMALALIFAVENALGLHCPCFDRDFSFACFIIFGHLSY